MSKYRVWLEFTDYRSRMKIDGEVMEWKDIQTLIGEKLLECNSAQQMDGDGYIFKGKYHSAGDEYLDFHYTLTWEVYRPTLGQNKVDDDAYRAQILAMDKHELLEEMVRFQEERAATGHLTVSMMIRGKILFRAVEENAETQELQLLTRSYRRHLEYEFDTFLKTQTGT